MTLYPTPKSLQKPISNSLSKTALLAQLLFFAPKLFAQTGPFSPRKPNRSRKAMLTRNRRVEDQPPPKDLFRDSGVKSDGQKTSPSQHLLLSFAEPGKGMEAAVIVAQGGGVQFWRCLWGNEGLEVAEGNWQAGKITALY